MIIIAKRLKEARLTTGISQKQLGVAAGINKCSANTIINKYENGERIPTFSTLKKIARILLVPVAYFYAEDDLTAELLYSYGKMNGKARKQILKYLKLVMS